MFLTGCLVLGKALSFTPTVPRDSYGVPIIKESNEADAWRAAGYAVAEDRMWQMELSRHTVEGKMSEILGSAGLPSDREVLKTAYSTAELQAQIDSLPEELQTAFRSYSEGVNDYLNAGNLPPEYAEHGLKPQPWKPTDSAAIGVWLLQYFGRGGAGAIRNTLAYTYLAGRKPLAGHVLDVLDDFLWQNDPTSPTTIAKVDESPNHPNFTGPTRSVTEKHLVMLPKFSLFELLPGLSVASRTQGTRLAQRVGAPFRTGSYCMVVGAKRSGTGLPCLLSGPQMGFTSPSIVHEMSIDTPSLHVVGMDVPGIPGVLVGHTDHVAWGITSGVADTDDIVYAPLVDSEHYKSGGETRTLDQLDFTIHVKGAADEAVHQQRTRDSVVLMQTKPHGDVPGYLLGRRSSYRGKELSSLVSIAGIWKAATVQEADASASKATMSFNVFVADNHGHIGYRYGGLMPIRTTDLDPRFPVPDDPQYDWKGMISVDQMPHVIDPKSGLITNWNNKPVSWWPNLDTPVWGKIFRVDSIRSNLTAPTLNVQDFELAAWKIARMDESWPFFRPYWDRAIDELSTEAAAHPERNDNSAAMVRQEAGGFDGMFLDGSRQANVYRIFFRNLRTSLFSDTVGTFTGEETFAQAAQPSLMLAALEGKTKFNYLHGRSASDLVKKALLDAVASEMKTQATYVPGQIRVKDGPSIPYGNRGTYIQVIELLADGPLGRNVLPPGVASTGPHSTDQIPLSRAWTYKPMHRPWGAN